MNFKLCHVVAKIWYNLILSVPPLPFFAVKGDGESWEKAFTVYIWQAYTDQIPWLTAKHKTSLRQPLENLKMVLVELSAADNCSATASATLENRILAAATSPGDCSNHAQKIHVRHDESNDLRKEEEFEEDEEEIIYMTEEDLLRELDKQEPAFQARTYGIPNCLLVSEYDLSCWNACKWIWSFRHWKLMIMISERSAHASLKAKLRAESHSKDYQLGRQQAFKTKGTASQKVIVLLSASLKGLYEASAKIVDLISSLYARHPCLFWLSLTESDVDFSSQ